MSLRRMSLTAILLVMVIVITGCAKKVPPPPPQPPAPPPAAAPPPPPPPPPPPRPAPAPPPRPLTEDEIFQRKSLDQLNAEKPLSDAYFDLDMSTVKDDARATLQKDADYMKRWPSVKVTVEGHCDERGTPEYNLALGDRRSVSVKDYLVSLGIGADRIMTVSKGKEQPVCMEHMESCWQQNRRGHFIITGK